MKRRTFLQGGLLCGGLAGLSAAPRDWGQESTELLKRFPVRQRTVPLPSIQSITPVVGDGHWIWQDPPEETGFLEPRDYELEVGIYLEGTGNAQQLRATTPVPVELPEQTINESKVESHGCSAGVRPISDESAQLTLAAPSIVKGQTISAHCKMRLTLFKQYQGFTKDQFKADQPAPPAAYKRQYLSNSPGIQTRASQVRVLQRELTQGTAHPWDVAHLIYRWVWDNIEARIGNFTGVVRALRDRVGDCEERAACFVALCRSAGIPARLVWIPNHNWAEFYLVDTDGKGHWIPAHTAAYSWFGWTGAHELVIQKGDNLYVPEKRQPLRLLADWSQWQGARPKTRFTAHIRPLAESPDVDPGPGARSKDQYGRWVLDRSHQLDDALRDGGLQDAYQVRVLNVK